MNLILWRHADAQPLPDSLTGRQSADLARELTPRGQKQASRAAAWLRQRLPEGTVVLTSPAQRAIQTAQALTDNYRVVRAIAPGASALDVLKAAGWPEGPGSVLVVGHQPALGRLASLLLAGQESDWSVKKGGIWWLASRQREDDGQIVLRAVISPDLL
ncbi:phosphohistidine phosphatase [Pandoraea thiooxydans]|uniref:Histidine phosphatase family protein n=1 Tax=Pandoraea thiooxydans TaxID=445709 RepID=A0A0G3F0K4_9BURK|nr:histidine phosphatase family protein [Pandoraea thiooxydans]AKJ70521.1 histidine phosphatase family protein [Pandoraea thiooxydans]APR96147.1 phosphohistidine phosphatase [Pandoraea thiooxydans]